MKIVAKRPFTEAEEEAVKKVLLERLGAAFRITLTYHDGIPRSPDGKYEDFQSEVEA